MTKVLSCIRTRPFRFLAFAVLAVGSVFLAFFLFFSVILPVLAWLLPGYESFFFELGAFGFYRTAQYVTLPSNVTVPKGQWVTWDDTCNDGSLIMIAPFGAAVDHPGPVILDAHGELVWASTDRFFDTTTNVDVQTYNGIPYLTFWAGNKHGGEGSGTAYMLDSRYRVYKEIKAVGQGLRTDLHDFSITNDGTALISTINDTRADLRPLGWFRRENGPIEDSVLQEIDIETGELVFQWRASDYFTPADSYFWNPVGGYDLIDPYDFFHLNTAQKDAKGNILISSRHLHKLLYVDGKTGDVIWTLGGKEEENDFADLSDGKATDFSWQHHAQWQPGEDGTITVLDNAAVGGMFPLHDKDMSSALMLKVDQDNRTVELLHSYTLDRRSPSQGSVQVLPSNHVLVGWGPVAAWSEHDISGDLLCEYHFAAGWYFAIPRVKNYRVFKVYDWKSTPDYPPIAIIKDAKVYTSWNGATEVRFWQLQGADNPAENGEYHDIETIEKQGFESSFDIPRDHDYRFLRVAALDGDKNVLGHSDPAEEAEGGGPTTALVFGIFFAIGGALGGVILYRLWSRRRRQESKASWELFDWRRYKYNLLEETDT